MSHRVALCDGFGVEVGKVADQEQIGEIRAISGKTKTDVPAEFLRDVTGSIFKQDKGCMPPKGGNCRFTPTGNAVRELQSVLPVALCVKTGIPMCRNTPILKKNRGIQKVFRKGKCYE